VTFIHTAPPLDERINREAPFSEYMRGLLASKHYELDSHGGLSATFRGRLSIEEPGAISNSSQDIVLPEAVIEVHYRQSNRVSIHIEAEEPDFFQAYSGKLSDFRVTGNSALYVPRSFFRLQRLVFLKLE
jgi:hypothetical protein